MSQGNDYNFYFSRNVQKKFHIVFTDNGTTYDIDNSMIVSEQVSLDESLCSEENLHFGACESSVFKAQIVSPVDSLVGKEIEVYMLLDNSNSRLVDDDGNYIVDHDGNYIVARDNSASELEVYLGLFKVYSDKPVADRSWRDIEAYDYMKDVLDADVSAWYQGLTYPITFADMVDSLFGYLWDEYGIRINYFNPQNLINANVSIPSAGFVVEGILSAKQVIEAICELNGVFGHINTFKDNGVLKKEFEFINLGSSNTYVPEWYIDGTGSYEDYIVEEITGIIARDSENDAGTTVGTTVNPYTIENNPLIYGIEGTQTLTTILTNLLGVIAHIPYRPYQVTSYGNPKAHIGDAIRIVTRNQTITSFILHRSLTGLQAMKDTYIATGEPKQNFSVNSISSQIMRTKGKVHILTNTVNELSSEIYDQTTGILSRITQLAGEIVLKVDNNGNLVEVSLSADPSTGSTFQVSADNIDFIANNVMQFVTGQLGISSDKFNIDKDTGEVSIDGKIVAQSGTIGGFNVSTSKPATNNTSANGGHYYANSLWVHVTSADSQYEYEIGMQGGGTTPGTIAFYVYRIPYGAEWIQANATPMFKVLKNGNLFCNNATLEGDIVVDEKVKVNRTPYSSSGQPATLTMFKATQEGVSHGGGLLVEDVFRFYEPNGSAWLYIDTSEETSNHNTKKLTGPIEISGSTKIRGYEMFYGSISSFWNMIPAVQNDGVMEIGKHLDFHYTSSHSSDYSFRLTNNADGQLTASGTITQGSSRKIKENIEDIEIEEAEKILELNPVKFDYIHGMKDRRGFIAEDVAEVLPNLVTPETEDIPASLDYNGIIPYLVKMVQKQQQEIDELKRRLEDG